MQNQPAKILSVRKRVVAFTLIFGALALAAQSSFAAAEAGGGEPFETVDLGNAKIVLIPLATATNVSDVMKSNDTPEVKKQKITAALAELTVPASALPSYCAYAASITRPDVPVSAEKRCVATLTGNDLIEDLAEIDPTVAPSPRYIQQQLSGYIQLIMFM